MRGRKGTGGERNEGERREEDKYFLASEFKVQALVCPNGSLGTRRIIMYLIKQSTL